MDVDYFYNAAGLCNPKDWEVQRLATFRHEMFKKIPDFINNKGFEIPNVNRRSGKTTNAIIESLYAEWHGYNTIIVCKNFVSQYFIRATYTNFKNRILSKIGPPLNGGSTNVVTSKLPSKYIGYKIIYDIEE